MSLGKSLHLSDLSVLSCGGLGDQDGIKALDTVPGIWKTFSKEWPIFVLLYRGKRTGPVARYTHMIQVAALQIGNFYLEL